MKSNQQDAYPLLQKVLLSYGDGGSYVALADNINDGIKQLVEQGKKAGQGTSPPPTTGGNPDDARHAQRDRHAGASADAPPLTGDLAAAADRVQTAITEVRAAQTSGDFERYGRALKALDEALTAFQQAQAARRSGTPAPSGSVRRRRRPQPAPSRAADAHPTPRARRPDRDGHPDRGLVRSSSGRRRRRRDRWVPFCGCPGAVRYG